MGKAALSREERSRSVAELHSIGVGHRAVLGGSAFLLPYGASN